MRIVILLSSVLGSAVRTGGLAVTTSLAPAPACAAKGGQAWLSTRPSPLDSASLTVGDRTAKICYSRPSARGRSIDSLLPLGIAWRTGANEPTTIELTGTLDVGGAVLKRGTYIILTVPQADRWLLVFHTTRDSEPGAMFKTMTQVAQGSGRVERLTSPIEQFTIRAASDGGQPAFILEWGLRRVRVSVRDAP